MKIIWVDLLCAGSVLKLVFLSRKISIRQVYYINRTLFFDRFYIFIISKILKYPVARVDQISVGDEKIQGTSLYEWIQLKIREVLDKWLSSASTRKEIQGISRRLSYDPFKFTEHLRESAYGHLLRPVEIYYLAEKTGGARNAVFLFRRCPFLKVIQLFLRQEQVFYYGISLFTKGAVQNRKAFIYDKIYNRQYYTHWLQSFFQLSLFYGAAFINALISSFFQKNPEARLSQCSHIGVEIKNMRFRTDEMNALYWLKDSGIQPSTVWGIEYEDYDPISLGQLRDSGIRRCRIATNPLKAWKRSPKNEQPGSLSVTMFFSDALKAFAYIPRLWSGMFLSRENRWLAYQGINFGVKVAFYTSIYKRLGIRILWSMCDIDPEKLIKAQVMEKRNGLFVGTHRSLHPMCRIDLQKYYDVFFVWGSYFRNHVFNLYPYRGVFETGYSFDYYFQEKRSKMRSLARAYKGKFVLSYQDNNMAPDVLYSMRMQKDMHTMLMELIDEEPNLQVLIKPKWKRFFDQVVQAVPQLQKYIDSQRIRVFLGDTELTKVTPAEIGMVSDLVVGLGISTAATECFFAGSPAFHADLTGFPKNVFAQRALNKIVFRDVKHLKKAIKKQIAGQGVTYEECQSFYADLDPFQDGKAYQRTGFVMKRLQDNLNAEYIPEKAIDQAKRAYADMLR
jgi:hypothetical protein